MRDRSRLYETGSLRKGSYIIKSISLGHFPSHNILDRICPVILHYIWHIVPRGENIYHPSQHWFLQNYFDIFNKYEWTFSFLKSIICSISRAFTAACKQDWQQISARTQCWSISCSFIKSIVTYNFQIETDHNCQNPTQHQVNPGWDKIFRFVATRDLYQEFRMR